MESCIVGGTFSAGRCILVLKGSMFLFCCIHLFVVFYKLSIMNNPICLQMITDCVQVFFFCVFLNKAADGAKMFVLMFANNYRLIFSLFSDQWVKSCVSISPLSKDMTHHRQSQRQKLRVDSMYSPTSVSTQTPWVLTVWLFIYIQMLNCCCRRCWCDYKLNQHDSQ